MADDLSPQHWQRGTPEFAALFCCRRCGAECPMSPGLGQAICETCCPIENEEHDYEYNRDLRTRTCRHCETPVDPDWYAD